MNRIFGESYLNKYDAMYDKHKNDKNFDNKMWLESFKRDDQDTYIALLEHNKKNTFSPEYYDASLYDYETNMLEMYETTADDTVEVARKKSVFDVENNKWDEEDIGKMTDKQYIQYQLAQSREQVAFEYERKLEKERKDTREWYEVAGGEFVGYLGELTEGVTTAVTGVFDAVVGLGYASVVGARDGANWLDSYVDYFGKGLTAIEKDTFRVALDEYERKYTKFKDIDGNITGYGKYATGITNSIGMMVPAIIANIATGGAAGVGMSIFYASIFSHNMYETAINPELADSPSWLKFGNAALKTGAEAVIEIGLGKLLGGTIQNAAIGLTGKSGLSAFTGIGKAAGFKYLLKSMGQEGLEEFFQDLGTNVVDQFSDMIYEGYGNNGVTFQTLIDSFTIGAMSSLFMSGGQIAIDRATTSVKNRQAFKQTGQKGMAELYTEVDGKLKKVTGANKLYLKSIISDFNSAADSLKKDKNKNNVELAKEVYGALTVMGELFSSFGKERLANAEKLLNRAIDAQAKRIENQATVKDKKYDSFLPKSEQDAVLKRGEAEILKNEQKAELIDKKYDSLLPKSEQDAVLKRGEAEILKAERKNEAANKKYDLFLPNKKLVTNEMTDYANTIMKDFNEMINGAAARNLSAKVKKELVEKVEEVVKKNAEKLKEAKVTKVTKLEIKKEVSQDIKDLEKDIKEASKPLPKPKPKTKPVETKPVETKPEKELSPKAEKAVTKLQEDYDFIVVVDGNIAIEEDKLLFVSEAWLENFTESEIYKFLKQEEILSTLLNSADIKELVDDILVFDKEFTKRDNITREQALMDFLFNESVYQAFVLSQEGKNLHKFKDYIFKLHDTIKRIGNRKKSDKNTLNQIYKKIKETMRRPTVKAILNWNMDAQSIGADSVLTESDKQLINQYKTRKAALNQETTTSAFEHVSDNIIRNSDFSEKETAIIKRGQEKDATFKEKKLASSLLLVADDSSDVSIQVEAFSDLALRAEDIQYVADMLETCRKELREKKNTRAVFELLNERIGKDYVVVSRTVYKYYDNQPVGFFVAKAIDPKTMSVEHVKDNFIDGFQKTKEMTEYARDRRSGYTAENLQSFVSIELINKEWKVIVVNELPDGKSSLVDNNYDFVYVTEDTSENMYNALLSEMNTVLRRDYSEFAQHDENVQKFWEDNKTIIEYLLRKRGITDVDVKARKYDVSVLPELHYLMYKVSLNDSHSMYENKLRTLDTELKHKEPAMSESYVKNTVEHEFDEMTRVANLRGEHDGVRDTYHSTLTSSADEVIGKLINDNILFAPNIDTIISDPAQYLSDEIMALFEGDLSEGNVYYKLKEYIEKQFETVSIDRHATLHTYTLVNDSVFDDLIKPTVKNAKTKFADIVPYLGPVGLDYFYKPAVLVELGLAKKNIKVVLKHTRQSFTSISREGNITITIGCVDAKHQYMENAEILHILNHEFRHVLQETSDLEPGFTTEFVVTKEMKEDIKKHAPEIFKNEKLTKIAASMGLGMSQTEDFIIRRFIYYLVGGEKNAYGVSASLLNTKPIYVDRYGSEVIIAMPWYSGPSLEHPNNGIYTTRFLQNSDRNSAIINKDNKMVFPRVELKPKTKEIIVTEDGKKKYIYDKKDYGVSKKKAGNTNLRHFLKEGKRTQMHPALQKFVIATTGTEGRLDKVIMNAITKGVLTKQSLYKYFRKAEKINDFTFDLINKHMFKNKFITNMQDLDRVVTDDISVYWAASIILRKEGLATESFLSELGNVDKLMAFINSTKNTKYWEQIYQLSTQFDWSKLYSDATDSVEYDSNIAKYMRVFAMRYCDGTLAGAFYMANAARKYMRLLQKEKQDKQTSMDKTITDDTRDDKDISVGDSLSEADTITSTYKTIANDIEALYNLEDTFDYSEDKMIKELLIASYESRVNQILTLPSLKLTAKEVNTIREWVLEADPKKGGPLNERIEDLEHWVNIGTATKSQRIELRKLIAIKNAVIDIALKESSNYADELVKLDKHEVAEKYRSIVEAEMTDTNISTNIVDKKVDNRIRIARRIQSLGTQLLNLVRQGKISFDSLPTEVQKMFELKTYTIKNKKVKQYELKPEVWSVGRGKAKLPGITSGRNLYEGKRDLANPNETQTQDISQILKNRNDLQSTLSMAKDLINNKETVLKTGFKTVKNVEKKLQKALVKKKNVKEKVSTEFEVKAKRRSADTPSNFTIMSDIPMPKIVKTLYDVAFENMAITEVQFASKDKDGHVLDRKLLGEKKFEGRLKHEVSNWEAFYEVNRTQLLALTRNDVLDMYEFFRSSNAMSLDGPTNKIVAFEMFTLGYMIDVARTNSLSWNLSQTQIDLLEKLYESKASNYGTGLNAVRQMLKVIDPFKKVIQHMLDDYGLDDTEVQPVLDSINAVQSETDPVARKILEQNLAAELDTLEQRMLAGDNETRTLWQKFKSLRFTFMLSSPVTWMRNIVSNVVVKNFNRAADTISGFVFTKKGYREGQLDLAGIKITTEVKNFIDNNVTNSVLFDSLFDEQSKYDNRGKVLGSKRSLFVSMIISSLESKYAATHRFDSDTMNAWSKFISDKISDKRFIKDAAQRYLGKLLTIQKIDLSQGLSDDVLQTFAEAVIMANEDYMHKRSFLTESIGKLKSTHPGIYEAITFWQPFLNSSFNWFAEIFKYTPVGLVNSLVRSARLEKQIDNIELRRNRGETIHDSRVTEYLIRRDVGKGVIGMTLTALGMMLAAFGVIRIDEDENNDKFYLYAGDLRMDITSIFGSSSVFVGAAVAQLWNKSGYSFEEVLRTTTSQMFEGFILSDMLGRHQHDRGIWDAFVSEGESVLRSVVPQFVQLMVRATNNKKIRYTPGLKGVLERWLNSFIPTQPAGARKVNPYTGEEESKYALPFIGELVGILGPKFLWSHISDEEAFSREYGVKKKELDAELTINGKKISLSSKTELNKYYGKLNKKTLSSIKSQKHYVQMPNGNYKTLYWNNLSDEQRNNVIDRELVKNGNIAKIHMWTQTMSKKYYASDSMWQTLKEHGIRTNVYRGDKGFVE